MITRSLDTLALAEGIDHNLDQTSLSPSCFRNGCTAGTAGKGMFAGLGTDPVTASTLIIDRGVPAGHYWWLNEFLKQWLYISVIAKPSWYGYAIRQNNTVP